ncbi:MAG TPA: flagellar export protein FliJ [Pirellulales bacterium]|jgi:flagellar export protein FliJ|nr:flagellar export protein FliJ [Pirellulales bacterium]
MARFQFRLATLQRLREVVRDERRGQLAEMLRLADSLEEQKRQVVENLRELAQSRRVSAGAVDVDRMLAASRYEAVLMLEQVNYERQLAAVAAEIEKRREALAAADRDVRTLEKLHESQLQRHREEQEQAAMKQLDEMALRGFRGEERPSWSDAF